MILNVKEKIKETDFETIRKSNDNEIILDLKSVEYLGSRDITRLLVILKEGKIIKLKNANLHIVDTLNVLKIEDMLKII